MVRIATLTMNPTIDVAYAVETVRPTHKMRCAGERTDPGGGGINVARVLDRLGADVSCHYLSGGATGHTLDGLLGELGLDCHPIRVAGQTRVAFNVYENSTGQEYRFVPPGPEIAASEWQAMLDQLAGAECDWLVASGSLPPGVPENFYALLAGPCRERGTPIVLDSSGDALASGLGAGGVHLAKPSAGELRKLTGRALETPDAIAGAAMELVEQGKAELVAVTMGHHGGVLASAAGPRFAPAIPVEASSAVGAGDSFLAAMVWALSEGWEPFEAFRYGMAAGSAAVLTPGTDLCHRADIERLYRDAPPV